MDRWIFALAISFVLICVAGCKTPCLECDQAVASSQPGTSVSVPDTWIQYRGGQLSEQSAFFGRFGAANYELLVNELGKRAAGKGLYPLPAGTRLAFRVRKPSGEVIYTGLMEKGSAAVEGWQFTAIDAAGTQDNVKEECLSCHQEQKDNDYLFSLPSAM